MKKAKPSKGSARTKRFLDGGAVGALAGLGTLAYLMSRKKKDEEGGKFEDLKSVEKTKTLKEQIGRGAEAPAMSAEVKRAMATSQGRDELIPEGADEAAMRSDVGLKRVMPAAKKPAVKPAVKPVVDKVVEKAAPAKKAPAASESSNTTPLTYYTPKPRKAEPVSKPYPQAEATVNLKKAEAERRSGQGLTPREEYTGIGSRKHIEGLKLERSQRLEEEAKKQLEKNKRENQPRKVFKSGGSVSSASKRADGIAQRGKTKGRIV